MDNNTLLIFMKKILECSSVSKSVHTLEQLESILDEQGAKEARDLVRLTIDGMPESKELAGRPIPLTRPNLLIAKRRAEERRAREKMNSRYGRC